MSFTIRIDNNVVNAVEQEKQDVNTDALFHKQKEQWETKIHKFG